MEQKIKTLTVNGVDYVPADAVRAMAAKRDGMSYCIVRTQSAGVFAGYVESCDGAEAVLRDARRIWYWDGAASLSQLAMSGTSKPENCKFPETIDRVTVFGVVEILDCTETARLSIESVAIWQA